MAGRYDRWHHLRLVGDSELAKSYLSEGRKWLEYAVQEAARLGSSTIRKVGPNGVVFTAVMSGGQPILMIDVRGVSGAREAVDLSGFVTWPTDADGNTALPDSARVILAGDAYRQVRQAAYSRLFPDVLTDPEDPESPTETGLAHAGNVDWQGREGWVVSWYGPRTRYLDANCPLDARVFFKGKMLVDMRDYLGSDVLVLGAAIASFTAGQRLVVVTEVPGTTRIERVSALPITGDPADASVLVITADYEEVDSRTTTDVNLVNHPWFFSPAGTEARQITRLTSALLERVITLVDEPGEPAGFSVSRSANTITRAGSTDSTGYTAGDYRTFYGKISLPVSRASSVDLRSYGGGPYSPGSPPGVLSNSASFDSESRVDVAYQLVPFLLSGWTLQTATAADADPWQIIAVDYKPDGSIAYGYGRGATGTDTESGDVTVSGNGDLSVSFASDTINIDATPTGDGTNWSIAASAVEDMVYPDASASWIANRTRQRTYVAAGLRVAGIELVAVDTATSLGSAEQTRSIAGFTSGAGTLYSVGTANTADGSATNPAGFPRAPQGSFPDVNAAVNGTSASSVASLSSTSYLESLYLLHMDLRYDALFAVHQQVTHTESSAITATRTDTVCDGTQTLASGNKVIYRTRGWILGDAVLDDSVTTVDTLGDAGSTSSFGVGGWSFTSASAGVLNQPTDWGGPFGTLFSITDWAFDQKWNTYEDIDIEGPPPGVAYAAGVTSHPFVNAGTLAWPIAIQPSATDAIIGYSIVPSIGEDAKFKWHFDADNQRFAASVCCYKNAWIYSIALPAINDGAHEFRFTSQCAVGAVEPLIERSGDPAFDHVYPIWLLGKTRGFRPP